MKKFLIKFTLRKRLENKVNIESFRGSDTGNYLDNHMLKFTSASTSSSITDRIFILQRIQRKATSILFFRKQQQKDSAVEGREFLLASVNFHIQKTISS